MVLAKCIADGLAPSTATLGEVARHVAELRLVFGTLDPDTSPTRQRRADFDEIASGFRAEPSPIHDHMAGVMERFAEGIGVRGATARREWEAMLAGYRKQFGGLATLLTVDFQYAGGEVREHEFYVARFADGWKKYITNEEVDSTFSSQLGTESTGSQ